MTNTERRPVLWQLRLSHYNEKARWALDHKRVPHTRRSLVPGPHILVTRRLTGSVDTTPVLVLDGRAIGDSTRIIAALEQRWPDPPLYPTDPAQRARALELEDYFDEELGPHIRRAVYHVLLEHPEIVVPLFAQGQPLATRLLLRAAFPVLRVGMRQRLTVNATAAQQSRERVVAAMDRLERELGSNRYLVGDRFTVADLTAASLFYPVVRPPEFPYPSAPDPLPRPGREFLESLRERPGGQWVADVYRRHRRPSSVPADR